MVYRVVRIRITVSIRCNALGVLAEVVMRVAVGALGVHEFLVMGMFVAVTVLCWGVWP